MNNTDVNKISLIGTVIGRFWKAADDCPRQKELPYKVDSAPTLSVYHIHFYWSPLYVEERDIILVLYYISEVQISASLIQATAGFEYPPIHRREKLHNSSTFSRRAKPEAALQTGSMFNIHRSWETLVKDKVKCQRVMNAPEQDYKEVWSLR